MDPGFQTQGKVTPVVLPDRVLGASGEPGGPDGGAGHAGPMCFYCGGALGGEVRISMEQPPMVCHQDCFTCAVCGCMLGDLLTPMFLRGQKIHCHTCYFNIIYP